MSKAGNGIKATDLANAVTTSWSLTDSARWLEFFSFISVPEVGKVIFSARLFAYTAANQLANNHK